MHFELYNHHVILQVPTNLGIQNVLLDTGNPAFSLFSNPRITEFRIDQHVQQVSDGPLIEVMRHSANFDEIGKLTGIPIDGILGYDFFIAHDIIINFREKHLQITDGPASDLEILEMPLIMNVPVLQLGIEDLQMNVLFDTGAMYSVIHCDFQSMLNDLGQTLSDYNPMLGSFDARLFSGKIQIGNITISPAIIACAPKYDLALKILHSKEVKGILGINTLLNREIYISYKTQRFGIK
ncbi:MAG: hypothetical protein N2747_08240 [Chitinophagaceae bacterium]|nr:hypothetical protein [Chitinophagaceae bacterium]